MAITFTVFWQINIRFFYQFNVRFFYQFCIDFSNILNGVFKTNRKNKIWVGDITYIHTKHGFLYLAIFIDIFSIKVVGWSMDKG